MEQVNLLERKVKDAVTLIQQLRNENEYLRNRLGDYEVRIQELESLLSGLKASQTQIEEGILNAIADLNGLEGASQAAPENKNTPYPADSAPVMYVTDESEEIPPGPEEQASSEAAPALEDNWDLSDDGDDRKPSEKDTTDEEPGLGIF